MHKYHELQGWKTIPVNEIKDSRKNALAMGPFGSNITTDNFVPFGIPVIRGVNLGGNKFNEENFVFVTKEKADELSSANAFPEDIVFTHRGTLGQVAIIPNDAKYTRYVVSQSQMKLTCDKNKVEPYFVYYYFISPIGQQQLLSYTSTTGVPALAQPLTSLKQMKIPNIPKAQQHKITSILQSIDNKITFLRSGNIILEKIIQSIFKSWFIDFDGQTEFVNSELGEIPKGWRVGKINEAVEIFDYKRVPLSELEREKRPGIFPYYGASEIIDYIDDYLFDGEYLLVAEDGENLRSRKIPIIFFAVGKFWVNNHAHILQGKNNFSNNFLWIFFKHLDLSPWITGAAQPKLNQENLLSIPIIIPEKEILLKFDSVTKIMSESIHKNLMSMDILTKIRDSLLPKLMSGEIRV